MTKLAIVSNGEEQNPLQPHIDYLQEVIDGKHDTKELFTLLDKIDAAATALVNAGVVEDFNKYDNLIGDAAV
ncbi:hypothetical protein [Methylobacter sp. BlB1]|uniref:hypothetical protein n=1 Tax=Methylobacter sp. BlB1 TaxID=2785914 RepID=UPI00189639CD|nr:hypothetical protein [Methylobacter sp. BlB1]MBF6650619.1 hypothetical protein [Methylobacter sp. BlB1]